MTNKVPYFTHDKEANAAYIYLRDSSIVKTIRINDTTNIDIDAEQNVTGVELLNPTAELPVGPLGRYLDRKALLNVRALYSALQRELGRA